MSKEELNKVSESSKPKIKIIHDWFIPWIFEGYDQGDMLEAFQHKFNKPIEKDITIYESYVMYCKYAINNG